MTQSLGRTIAHGCTQACGQCLEPTPITDFRVEAGDEDTFCIVKVVESPLLVHRNPPVVLDSCRRLSSNRNRQLTSSFLIPVRVVPPCAVVHGPCDFTQALDPVLAQVPTTSLHQHHRPQQPLLLSSTSTPSLYSGAFSIQEYLLFPILVDLALVHRSFSARSSCSSLLSRPLQGVVTLRSDTVVSVPTVPFYIPRLFS